MYHAACKVEFQPFKQAVLTADVFQLSQKICFFKLKNVSCEYNRLNGKQPCRVSDRQYEYVTVVYLSCDEGVVLLLSLQCSTGTRRIILLMFYTKYEVLRKKLKNVSCLVRDVTNKRMR